MVRFGGKRRRSPSPSDAIQLSRSLVSRLVGRKSFERISSSSSILLPDHTALPPLKSRLLTSPHTVQGSFLLPLYMFRLAIRAPAAARSIHTTAPSAKANPYLLGSHGPKPASDPPVLRMLMFGKPGAGKGTLSARLTKKYDVSFLSAGDLLRQHIAEKTEVGRVAEEIMANGGLLPDDVMIRVVSSKLDLLRDKHWILDGFPRTLGQGELLDGHLRNNNTPLTLIVNLDVLDKVILSRIADRWIHPGSGRVYNLSYNRPKVEGHDDITGEPLVKRPDDNPEIFARRLKAFYTTTSPLLSYYASRASPSTRLVTLSGSTSDEIWPQLEDVVQRTFRTRPRIEKSSVHEAVIRTPSAAKDSAAATMA